MPALQKKWIAKKLSLKWTRKSIATLKSANIREIWKKVSYASKILPAPLHNWKKNDGLFLANKGRGQGGETGKFQSFLQLAAIHGFFVNDGWAKD